MVRTSILEAGWRWRIKGNILGHNNSSHYSLAHKCKYSLVFMQSEYINCRTYISQRKIWDNSLRSEKYLTYVLGTLCTVSAISSLHTRKLSITCISGTMTIPSLYGLMLIQYTQQPEWFIIHTTGKWYLQPTQLPQWNSTYHRKRPFPTTCALVCVQTNLIAQRLITNIAGKQTTRFTWKWKLPTMYHQISPPIQIFVMYEGDSNENPVSAKKSRSYCVLH